MTYAGDIGVEEVWRNLRDEPSAVLIDVRTAAEWAFVGAPELSDAGKDVIKVSWQTLPGMVLNASFVDEVKAQGVNEGAKIYLLCRSGQRSRDAAIALTAAGYKQCFNVAEGFEGGPDGDQHRGNLNGWKAAGLPWAQS